MEILTDPSVRGSGVTAVHVTVHVDGQAQAWVNTYPDFVTVEIWQRAAAVSVFVQNVAQADDLIRVLHLARAELASLQSAASPSGATSSAGSAGSSLVV